MFKFVISFLLASTAHAVLPDAPERSIVIQNCTPCHSDDIIMQNRMSRKNWDKTIDWMQQTQNLWPLPPATRTKILDYLERVQGPLDHYEDAMDGLGPRSVNPFPITHP